MTTAKAWRGLSLGTIALLALAARAQEPPGGHQRVPRAAIISAMRAEQGYDRRATTNQSRLQTRVLLRLAREAADSGAAAALFIDHEDWFQAYLEVLGLRPEQAPLSVRLSYQHQYDIVVDGRPGAVVGRVRAGPPPSQALNVRWRSRGRTRAYSYRDPLSRPVLEMTFQPTVAYRLLRLEGIVMLDQIAGISGRPVNGPLSLLFRLIGSAHAVWSRSALAPDGCQVVVGQGRKGPISKTATVTIQPDGKVDPAAFEQRADLTALEQRLRQPIDIEYRPWTLD
jgi:hypothetical protein